MKKPLVSATWLRENLNHPELVILDASQKSNKDNLKSEFANIQIKSARFFDLKNHFSDKMSPFPNTLPSPKQFEEECRKLGISSSSKIVVYDHLGVHTSPRVWWMFRTMGHENIAVLNGGLPDWIDKGFETEQMKNSSFETGDFEANFQPALVNDYDLILENISKQRAIVIDARSTGRFDGTAPEPRRGLKSGHIPNSFNIPYTDVLEDGKYKSKPELSELFNHVNMEDTPLIFTCGSGITACIILLAGELISPNQKSVYDGSWTEWAQLKEENVETTEF